MRTAQAIRCLDERVLASQHAATGSISLVETRDVDQDIAVSCTWTYRCSECGRVAVELSRVQAEALLGSHECALVGAA